MLALMLGLVMSEAELEVFNAVRELVQEALPDNAKTPIV